MAQTSETPVERYGAKGGPMARTAFYFEDGNGHAVKIRRWLPWGHPDRVVMMSSAEEDES